MSRTWIYQTMASDSALVTAMPGGIHQSTALDKAPHQKPFIMYRQTSDVTTIRGDDHDQVRSCGYMIFVHDIPGDYLAIDTHIESLRGLFEDTIDQAAGVIRSRWVETGDDGRDDDLGTIFKLVRLQVYYRV